MRSIKRIDEFTTFLAHIWKTRCPDWRFGQFVSNVFGEISVKHGDIFFPEEDKMMKYIAEYFNTTVEDIQAELKEEANK